jgi:hypothetical protein
VRVRYRVWGFIAATAARSRTDRRKRAIVSNMRPPARTVPTSEPEVFERPRRVANFVLRGGVPSSAARLVAIRLVVLDVAVDATLRHGGHQLHVGEPVGEGSRV